MLFCLCRRYVANRLPWASAEMAVLYVFGFWFSSGYINTCALPHCLITHMIWSICMHDNLRHRKGHPSNAEPVEVACSDADAPSSWRRSWCRQPSPQRLEAPWR